MSRTTCLYCGGPLVPGRYSHWQDCANRCPQASRYEGGFDARTYALVRRPTAEQLRKGAPSRPGGG